MTRTLTTKGLIIGAGHDAAVFAQSIKGLLEHSATLWAG